LVYSALVSAIFGVGGAVLTVTMMGSSADESQAASAVQTASATGRPAVLRTNTVVVQSDSEKVRALEERLNGLSKERGSDQPPPRPSPEESLRQLEQRHRELERFHEEDAPDPTWSRQAEQSLTAGLHSLGEELGFSLESSECKTSSCRAIVRWSDLKSAETKASQLAERAFPGLNCAQTVLRRATNDAEPSNTVALYLDCTDQRAGLVQTSTTQP
jgi:hypothetical protein